MATELDQAHDHLRQAARGFADRLGERLVGNDTVHHLRQAARHALMAGVEAIDKAEARRTAPAADAGTGDKPQAAEGGCCGSKPAATCG